MQSTSLLHKFLQFYVISLVAISIAYLTIVPVSESKVVTNKMRYGSANKGKTESSSIPLEQVFELAASTTRSTQHEASPLQNSYTINSRDKQTGKRDNNINYKSLDEEDKRLLKKFYSETKRGDPFLGDTLSTESLWDSQEIGGLDALLDGEPELLRKQTSGYGDIKQTKLQSADDWTLEPEIFDDNLDDFGTYNKNPITPIDGDTQARYSPSLRLLTSYNPIASSPQQSVGRNIYMSPKDNRLVGATLYGQDEYTKPEVSSKSAVEAVKLHDELMRKPPKDGKVRVRMYYHRAIHDDSKLYGTGPWKYWGHGWGLEFGYDPRSEKKNKDFYQKGYTIERAYGRDFCIDKANCRQPDPEFFDDPHNVGKYSKQQYAEAAAKLKKQPKKKEPKRNFHEYRRL